MLCCVMQAELVTEAGMDSDPFEVFMLIIAGCLMLLMAIARAMQGGIAG
jgi:hypothetical protein